MSNLHQDKYVSKLLIGFTFVILGVLTIMYAAFERTRTDDWYFWGIVATVAVNTGIILMGSAFVHKIKSDLIRRQKQREQQKTFTSD